MAKLAGLLVGVFFRSIEVEDGAELPAGGSTVLVANHQNGLVDGLVLMAALPRYPRWLGKATLWRIVPLRPLLNLAGVIPVHRVGETGEVPSEEVREAGNDAAFASARRLLGEGAMVAIFPEGVSHDEPSLQGLRTGAARIALDAGGDTVISPVGLVYDDKSRFRSRALVRVGPPRAVAPYRHDRSGVRALTAHIDDDLRSVVPGHRSWADARRWAALAAMVVPGGLADREALTRRLAELAGDVEGTGAAAELDACVAEQEALDRRMALLGIDAGSLAADPRRWAASGVVGRALVDVALGAPATAVGLVTHVVPYTLVKLAARRAGNIGMRATIKVGGCLGAFPVTYVAIGVVAGRRWGWRAGVAALAVTPLCGWVTVLTGERLEAIGGITRLREVARRDQAGMAELRARRTALVDRVDALLSARQVPGDLLDR